MLQQIKTFTAIVGLCTVTAMGNAQPLKVPAPSPFQSVKQAFALSDITIEYSRPSVKGRTIFGDLVPYGKIWRTGANASTKIAFGEDVKVEGLSVPSGTYALYTIPNEKGWEVMLYKDLKLGGNTEDYDKANELGRFTVNPTKVNDKVETMTFSIDNITNKSASIQLTWDHTRISFNVVADIDARIMKNIEASVYKDNRPYYQAASYYYENNKDLVKAAEWVDKAIEQNPKAYWVYLLKAKIKTKQGDKKAAIATAEQLIPIAKEAKSEDYVKMAEKLIAENKK